MEDECTAFVALLRACAKKKDIGKGSKIHDEILKRGWLERCSDALVTMYAKCGALAKAKALLDMHRSMDVITWTALIAGYAREGQCQDALDYFERMQLQGIPPDAVTYTSILKAYGSTGAAEEGKKIHFEIVKQGLLHNNIVLGGALVDMYARCGALSMAHRVLEELPYRNVVTWNALIAGYARKGQGQQALACFECMQSEGISPDAVTYTCISKACGTLGAADIGQQIHDKIADQGLLHNNIVLGGALVGMYAKCGDLEKARRVLEDLPSRTVVSWSALMTGYIEEGQAKEALNCFTCMQHENISPDAVTYNCILKACGISGAVDKGKEIHDEIIRQGLLGDNNVLSGALVDMYAKCGALSEAKRVLEKLPSRDVVSWSALIAGYASKAQGEQALKCFCRMRRESISPDAVTYASILKACGSLGALDEGEQIHEEITRQGFLQSDAVFGGTLVDMYAKCNALFKAHCVLEELPSRDVFTWSALIAGYVQEGRGEQALNSFERMQQEGIFPNVVTLGSILNVCNHLGPIEEGHSLFVNMSPKFGVEPNSECYTCMIDLLGRSGHLERAVKLVHEMKFCDNAAIWNALLGACLKWKDVNTGRWAFEQAVQADRSDGSAYVLMANIYEAAGMLENAKRIQALRMGNKAWNKPMLSMWTDASGGVRGPLVQVVKDA
ncbi:hypothetical protein GOP47_0023314 [Adiantum capillus-veneris]|uniref:Pentatricopeptide repeat-containing protein n=1 Tax=Adiantum capillus-veneris TaxID=13818 RepID=A0A9D4U7W9_ADICA|nr:hypothetical protein GOP47_0023314 [Adiantum capillus-veneris]